MYTNFALAEVMEEGQNLTLKPQKKKSNVKTCAWVYTHNNYKESDVIKCWEWMEDHCAYAIMAFEYSNDGTPHLQGYFRTVRTNSIRYDHF